MAVLKPLNGHSRACKANPNFLKQQVSISIPYHWKNSRGLEATNVNRISLLATHTVKQNHTCLKVKAWRLSKVQFCPGSEVKSQKATKKHPLLLTASVSSHLQTRKFLTSTTLSLRKASPQRKKFRTTVNHQLAQSNFPTWLLSSPAK